MGAWNWSAVAFAIALIVGAVVAWWLARGCVVTRIGAVGSALGGTLSLVGLVVLADPDMSFRVSSAVTIGAGAWLFAFALAGGIRGQLIDRRERAAAASAASASSGRLRQRQREVTRA